MKSAFLKLFRWHFNRDTVKLMDKDVNFEAKSPQQHL